MSTTSNHSSLFTSYSALSTQHSALILLIGLPGSGKSTLTKQLLAECPQMSLISTDVIRGQLFGSQAVQGPWLLIWREIERQFQQAISTENTAIFDATNAQRRHRREVIALARNLGFSQITGIWVDTPVWLCLARNKRRSRQVPEEIILRMHRQLRDAPPSLEEGLDNLIRLSEKSEYGNCDRLVSENHT
ncbi:AAA family ATPase [Nostoc edaphicum CCNP1411]|uniref:AAA family ATPase n=1 Tax=Nostoc edaphicum CCNP1411 TaxID=1472755 RepID=A0A7D7Q9V3_9NOSO|nr:AAA family ATPase [Nostoc edaphicum]QMS88515.1 AAA family ATPase [Nostoc edaphicum CCNP1411]